MHKKENTFLREITEVLQLLKNSKANPIEEFEGESQEWRVGRSVVFEGNY